MISDVPVKDVAVCGDSMTPCGVLLMGLQVNWFDHLRRAVYTGDRHMGELSQNVAWDGR